MTKRTREEGQEVGCSIVRDVRISRREEGNQDVQEDDRGEDVPPGDVVIRSVRGVQLNVQIKGTHM